MTDTLAEKLRQITADDNDEADILFEAADRIEALEKALWFYAEYVPRFSEQDFRSVARAALEGKDGD